MTANLLCCGRMLLLLLRRVLRRTRWPSMPHDRPRRHLCAKQRARPPRQLHMHDRRASREP